MKTVFALTVVCLLVPARAALAQDETGTPIDVDGQGEASGEATASGEASASASGEVSVTGTARGSGGALGVGVLAMLTGPFGASVVYDPGAFHIEGVLGFATNGVTEIDLGGRFWYHLHTSQAADFSLGGGLGVSSLNADGDGGDQTNFHIELGAQLRVFIVPNVALSATAGLGIVAGDQESLTLTGQLLGGVGMSYFF